LVPVDRDQLDAHQSGLRAQPQHVGEQIGERSFMAARKRAIVA
jgi:hypothetical protein